MLQEENSPKETSQRVILSGQIVQYDLDDEDDFYSVMLLVDGDEIYVIEPDREGSRLEEYLDRWVTVKGEVEDKNGDNYLTAHTFELNDDDLAFEMDW